ncbi:MAG: 30S ribosomal protein S28e [archaeon]
MAEQKPQQQKGKSREDKQAGASESYPSKVVEIIRRTGATGEITQVRCEVLDGRERGKVLRRNVKGPVRMGDILMLKQTYIEAAEIRQV